MNKQVTTLDTLTEARIRQIAYSIYEAATQDMPELEGNEELAQDIIPDFFYAGSPIACGCTKEEERLWREVLTEAERKLIIKRTV
jgi:hypothetical protein